MRRNSIYCKITLRSKMTPPVFLHVVQGTFPADKKIKAARQCNLQ